MGLMIQETSDLALTVNLIQKDPYLCKKVHDGDNHPAIWFSSMKLKIEN